METGSDICIQEGHLTREISKIFGEEVRNPSACVNFCQKEKKREMCGLEPKSNHERSWAFCNRLPIYTIIGNVIVKLIVYDYICNR